MLGSKHILHCIGTVIARHLDSLYLLVETTKMWPKFLITKVWLQLASTMICLSSSPVLYTPCLKTYHIWLATTWHTWTDFDICWQKCYR